MRPKFPRRNIRVQYANFPQTGESPPHLMRDLGSDSTPPVSTKNKKLCDIPDVMIARDLRSFLQ
jgi:hypothetical protein